MTSRQIAESILKQATIDCDISLDTCFRIPRTVDLDPLAVTLENRIGQHFDTLLPICSLPNTNTWRTRDQLLDQVEGLVRNEQIKGPSLIRSW